MKRFIALCLCIIMTICFTSMGVSAKDNDKMDSEKKARTSSIIETYNNLYEKNEGDTDKALKSLLKEYPSLSISSTKSYYEVKDGKMKLIGRSEYDYTSEKEEIVLPLSTMGDIQFTDSAVYDSDWDSYVYFGSWNWGLGQPDESNLEPWDCIGFYTLDPDIAKANEYILYGYNTAGIRTIYYNTDTGQNSGDVAKGTENNYGVAFWHNEDYVDHGNLSVPLIYTGGSVKVMLKYGHSWTESSITGVGGSVSIDGAGFDISWDTDVLHWPDVVTSAGEYIP